MPFGRGPREEAQSILLRRKWWLPLNLGRGESYESEFARGSSYHQKCSNYALTNLLFGLCRSVWDWCLSPFLVLIPELQHAPLPFKVLQAREHAPTLCPSIIFTLGLPIESIKELGVALINSSYHTYISFIFSWLNYNTSYSSWFATSYGYPFVMVLVWSYHWEFRYSFILTPLWEWAYNNPRYTSKYYHSYCFGKWNTCSKGSHSPFLLPHLTTSGCFYHQRQLLNFNYCCHCWCNSHRYGAMNINDDNKCDDDDSYF
jgi:hypothetical protein